VKFRKKCNDIYLSELKGKALMIRPTGLTKIANCHSGFYIRPNSSGKSKVFSRLLIATPKAFELLKKNTQILEMLEQDFGENGKGKIRAETIVTLNKSGFIIVFFPVRNKPAENGYFGIRLAGQDEQIEFANAKKSLSPANLRNIDIHSKLLGIEFTGLRKNQLSEAELRVLLARVCIEHNPDPLGLSPIQETIGKVSVLEEGAAERPDILDAMPDGRLHLQITRAKIENFAGDPPDFNIRLESVEQ
jgi:hypothetical protein